MNSLLGTLLGSKRLVMVVLRADVIHVGAVPDEAREIAAMHLRVAPRRVFVEQIAQIEMRHAHEGFPVVL